MANTGVGTTGDVTLNIEPFKRPFDKFRYPSLILVSFHVFDFLSVP